MHDGVRTFGRGVRYLLRWVLVLGGGIILFLTTHTALFLTTHTATSGRPSDTVVVALLGLGALLVVFGASGAKMDSFEGPGGWKATLAASSTTSGAVQSLAVAEAFAADVTLPLVVRAEALQVVARVHRARDYERAIGDLLSKTWVGVAGVQVRQAPDFDQADFEVTAGGGTVRIEVLWLHRRWTLAKRYGFCGDAAQQAWEKQYLGDDVTVVVTNLKPTDPRIESGKPGAPEYLVVTGVTDRSGQEKLAAAIAKALALGPPPWSAVTVEESSESHPRAPRKGTIRAVQRPVPRAPRKGTIRAVQRPRVSPAAQDRDTEQGVPAAQDRDTESRSRRRSSWRRHRPRAH